MSELEQMVKNTIGEMIQTVNQLLDEKKFDKAMEVVRTVESGLTPIYHAAPPGVEGMVKHYTALVIMETYMDAVQHNAAGAPQWQELLDEGYVASSRAAELMPQYQPAQKLYPAFVKLKSPQSVNQIQQCCEQGDAYRENRNYLAAIQSYDEALALLKSSGSVDNHFEGILHLQIATSIKNGHYYAARWAAGDEGMELSSYERKYDLLPRFNELIPRGFNEARQAVSMLQGNAQASKLMDEYCEMRENGPLLFDW